MSYIAEAHNDWHTVNGWNATCPFDCGAGEEMYDPQDYDDVIEAYEDRVNSYIYPDIPF